MKKITIFILFFALFCTALSAQSAEKVTEMLEAETVSLADVAYFASTYLGISEDEVENEVALADLAAYVDLSKIGERADSLAYDDFAYFCTTTWNIKGGIMLRATKAPRYALRELQAMGYIPMSINPKAKVDGPEALTIITNCIDYSVMKETIDLDSISGAAAIDFQSSFSR